MLKVARFGKLFITLQPRNDSKMKTILTRRTIRKYADREVSETLLNRLFSEAARTQTMGNLQLYSVVVTRSEEMKAKLSPAHFNQPMVKAAPVVLTICADFNRTSVWARNRQATPGYDNFLSFINAATDALLFTQTLCNLMDEEGLGYCYLGTTVYMPQMIIDTLQLPKLVMPVATLTVGWPAVSTARPIRTTPPPTSIPIILLRNNCPRTATSARLTRRRRSHRSSPTSVTRRKTMRQCQQVCSRR